MNDGNYYMGQFKNKKRDGWGIWIQKDGFHIILNEWENDRRHGYSKEVVDIGYVWLGRMKKGKWIEKHEYLWEGDTLIKANDNAV